ncbi:MAG: hypothetical protein WCA09_14145 [Burkholderiales bacterium]
MCSQRGAVLLALMVIVILGMLWLLVSTLSGSGQYTAAARNRNAAVLHRAKLALSGYVARQAVLAAESNPGRLPCPEARGYVGTANEGIAAGSCTLPALGRLPWRTLGLDRPTDADGEPLWYAVSAGWALPRPGAALTINSNSPAGLGLDGRANVAVALIIAPGSPLRVTASTGCASRMQSRGKTPPDVRDYLECENATLPADASFASTGPIGSFNDQVLPVTRADLLPGIEAAIKVRIERDVVPQLRNVYAGPEWGLPPGSAVFPYAAPFADPGASDFRGVIGVDQGLLPFSQSGDCNPGGDARCIPSLTAWNARRAPSVAQVGGTGRLRATQCGYDADANAWCRGSYEGAPLLRLSAVRENVALALRKFNPQRAALYYHSSTGWTPVASAVSGRLAADASASIDLVGGLPDLGRETDFHMIMGQDVLADHPLLDRDEPTSGWFVRNEWFRLVYYAFAPQFAPGGAGGCSETEPVTCLQVANLEPANKQRAILVLAGRSLADAPRPNSRLADFLDSEENRNGDSRFEQRPVGAAFNDRIVALDANP